MTKLLSPKRIAALVFGLVLTAVAGAAFALWSQSGTGTGSAKATSAVPSAVTPGTVTADLYPGFTGGDVFFKVTNPNPYPVRFTSLTPGAVTSSDATNCPASNVTVASRSNLSIDVPANTTTAVERSVADVVTMAAAAPDGCQGVSFTLNVTLAGVQQ